MPGKKDIAKDFLLPLVSEGVNVSVYLLNGIGLRGRITNVDEKTITLSGKGNSERVVFKKFICAIQPDGNDETRSANIPKIIRACPICPNFETKLITLEH